VEWEVQQYEGSRGSGGNEIWEMLVTTFAIGIGIPKEYMGAGDASTRANAITSTEPAVKEFEARRHKLETLILRVVNFLAEANGIVLGPDEVEVSWPEMAPENIKEKVERLIMEMEKDIFTKQRVCEMIANEEGVKNYDFLKEMGNRLIEKTSGATKALNDASQPMIQPFQNPMNNPEQPEESGPTSTSNEGRKAVKAAGQTL
jgi:hypothetical protein